MPGPLSPKPVMKLWRVKYCAVPFRDNAPRIVYVEAKTANDAHAIAKRHGETKLGQEVRVWECEEAPALPAGRVVGEG